MQDRIEQFLEYLAVECGLAANSIKAYRQDLEHFAEFLTAKAKMTFQR